MMSCHDATAGDGREEFIALSSSDPQYAADAGIIGRRLDSLHAGKVGQRVTVKTLYKHFHDAGRGELIPRVSPAEDFAEDLDDETVERVTTEDPVGCLPDRWVWVTKAEQFIGRSDCQRLSPFQFKSHHRSEEHTSALQSLMRISYAYICLTTTKLQLTTLIYTNKLIKSK